MFGQPINEVFGDVDWEMFMTSVFEDLDYVLKNESIYKSPIYGVLNICRVLKLIISNEKSIQSKYEAGKWGIENLPIEYKSLVEKVLAAYCADSEIDKSEYKTSALILNNDELNKLCNYVNQSKREYIEKIKLT